MLVILAFILGLTYGTYLFWQQLKDYDVLWNEHMKLLREMQQKQLFTTTKPSRN